jgi:hypothetical protein
VTEGAKEKQGREADAHPTRFSTRLAWALLVLSFALTVMSLWLLVLNLSHPDVHVYDYWVESTLAAMGFSAVGAVLASRIPPDNFIGWLFWMVGLPFAVTHFAGQYAIYTLLAEPGSPLPAGEAAAWLSSWFWVLQLGCMVLVVLLFPDGRLPGRARRWFAWLIVLSVLLGAVLGALSPGPILSLGSIHNPLAVQGLPNAQEPIQMLMVVLLAVAAGSLLIRWIHARGVERQQIKWFLYAIALAASGAILQYAISEPLELVLLGWVGRTLVLAGLAGIPISMGIAITRYRLYEIDLVINRTLVYGPLTATLVALYFGAVLLLQRLFVALTGERSTLAVVASTLLIAALFNPLRRRIQSFIDRRFYRRKYDAAKTLEAFSAKLRDETNLKALNDHLVGVVRETMQPAHVSLWLHPDTTSESERAR